jgi:hypothetical protein
VLFQARCTYKLIPDLLRVLRESSSYSVRILSVDPCPSRVSRDRVADTLGLREQQYLLLTKLVRAFNGIVIAGCEFSTETINAMVVVGTVVTSWALCPR